MVNEILSFTLLILITYRCIVDLKDNKKDK